MHFIIKNVHISEGIVTQIQYEAICEESVTPTSQRDCPPARGHLGSLFQDALSGSKLHKEFEGRVSWTRECCSNKDIPGVENTGHMVM